jgi:hypothetical protein
VIVAVTTVGMVEVAVDEIVDVVSMGHGIVPAAGPVGVARVVGAAGVGRGARAGVGAVHRDGALVDVPVVGVVQVAVVQVVDVVAVFHRLVAAARAVGVVVGLVGLMLAHVLLPS